MVEQTVSAFGRLEAAFNNAGVQSPAKHAERRHQSRFEALEG
jgi:NAD(P)-dependent dehydrogenase (short-subunit alcohol dehydrogenase family)